MINENEAKRQRHINEIRERVNTTDADVVEQRLYILSLSFFELRSKLYLF